LQNNTIQIFLQSLIALTKERDVYTLEATLKHAVAELVRSSAGVSVVAINVYHLKEVSQIFFNIVSDGHQESKQDVTPALCQLLLDCYNTGEYCLYKDQGQTVHLFPLKNEVAHQNAVLSVEADFENPLLSQSICRLLDVYQNYIHLINENERDTLTGLLNRKTFDSRINKVLSQMGHKNKRKKDKNVHDYYLAIFDIDHFKRVNDEYGHLIGDEVLLLFAQLMTNTFRDNDLIFRFGGEEFVCVFGCAKATDINLVLERFVQVLRNFTFPQVGKVTVSVGYASLSLNITPSQSVDRADLALYYAKNHGRDQICHYEALIEQCLLKDEIKTGEIELF
jgi:diguanylate cyclase (GGDEF)-like protein